MATRLSSDATAERLGEFLCRAGARRTDIRPIVTLARRLRRSTAPGVETPALIALIGRVADVLAQQALDHAWRRFEVGMIVEAVAELTGLPADVIRREIHERVARDPRVIALSPAVATEAELKILYALTGTEAVSLWTMNQVDGLTCAFSAGEAKPSRRARLVARAVLDGRKTERSRTTYGIAVLRWQQPEAALVFVAEDDEAKLSMAAAEAAGAALTLVREREALLLRSASRERALVEAGERLLARLGFDLHDGPIQDVAALAGDVRLLRGQLAGVSADRNSSHVLVGRIDDLEARILAVDQSLRGIVDSLESPTMTRRPLDDVLRREVEGFGAQAETEVELSIRGDFSELTDSQRIALIRIVQESLTNVREHSGATKVKVTVTRSRDELSAVVTDNGRGFDVERTLVRSARNGRVGLLGMSERARLLGGRFDVDSRRGGPTRISAVLPAWRPATAQPVTAETLVSIG